MQVEEAGALSRMVAVPSLNHSTPHPHPHNRPGACRGPRRRGGGRLSSLIHSFTPHPTPLSTRPFPPIQAPAEAPAEEEEAGEDEEEPEAKKAKGDEEEEEEDEDA